MTTWPVRMVLMGLLVGVAAVSAVAIYGYRNDLPAGMTVSGWNVGGMKAAIFEQELSKKVRLLENKQVVLKADLPSSGVRERTAVLGELGLRIRTEVVSAEVVRLTSGPFWKRALQRWELRRRTPTLQIGLDRQIFAAALQKLWPELHQTKPIDAKRIITAADQVKYVPEVNATRLDAEALEQALAKAVHSGGSEPILLEGAGLNKFFPAEAALRPEGALLSAEPLLLEVPVYTLQPNVTVESLRSQGIERVIARYSTSFVRSGEGRKHNVSSAAAVVHDMLMKPGDVFDYGKVIAETEKRFGFRQAPVILNGKLVPGIGGGICQVSTTLYNAVLLAGLEIVERRNHSLPVGYVPLGRDATFADGYINFRFKNTTGKHLLIRTSAENGVLTVKLFGTMARDVSYEITSATVRTIRPPAKYVRNPSLPKGKVSLLQRGKPGYVVETYRIKKVGGKIVDKEKISEDTYKAQPSLYASNSGGAPQTRNPERDRRDIIEDGVRAPVFN